MSDADITALVAMLRHIQCEPASFDTYSMASAAERAADAIERLRSSSGASESRTTSLLLSQAARLLREYADDAHAEDVPDVLRWLAVYEGRSAPEPSGKDGRLAQLHDMLHTDQTGLAAGLENVLRIVGGFRWVTEGRGCYEWDDERYRAEMGSMLDQIGAAAKATIDAWKAGGIPRPCCKLCDSPGEPGGDLLKEAKWLILTTCTSGYREGSAADTQWQTRRDAWMQAVGLSPTKGEKHD